MNKTSQQRLAALERELKTAPRRGLCESAGWAADIPAIGGVYAVWAREPKAPVYVGSTVCLRDRMRDIGRKVNHTCLRKLARVLNLENATERELSKELAKLYTLSFIAIDFGRVEFEEYLSLRWKGKLLNSPSRRIGRSTQYSWLSA
jgi:hypothetical protein